ncbi:hypothetical protein [Pandoraea communis]|uniref:Uncharacterized protein n=1 Tax=Pandoraea communis TaxID=2508297 RepID=A0A5E4SF31_9BURK|nr:hypothetical protein [Pandoraea communis]MDM8354732.1 hypothetical protein [Pandoraea communis]VVD72758.1 hypothetical protein PCO31111_00711 [Pandoraea communis]
MKQVLIASAFVAACLTAGAVSAAEKSQPAAQPQQTQQQAQTQTQAQPSPVAAPVQTSTVAPVYEVPGRVNRAGSIYFGQ